MNEPDNTLPVFTVPVSQDATAIDGLNGHDARLIWDLVSNMRKPVDVLAAYGVTPAEFAAKAQNPIFAGAYREAEKVWKSDMNIKTRIQLKASFLLEDSLLSLFNIIRAEGVGITSKLAAIEQLTKISTVSVVPKNESGIEKHNIIINIGGDKPPIKITAENPSGTATLTSP
jgi:hypothetical protein